MDEDGTVEITLQGSDPDPGALTFEIVSGPAHGAIEAFDAAAGTLVYRPGPDYAGSDTIRFAVVDAGGARSEADVAISVLPVNDRPTLAGPAAVAAIAEQDVVVALTLADVETPLEDLVVSIEAGPANGTATISGQSLIYRADPGFSGADGVTLRVTDTGQPAGTDVLQSLPLTIGFDVSLPNRAPEIAPIADRSVDEGGELVVPVTATDPEGAGVTLSLVAGPAGATLSGGAIRWSPPGGETAPVVFTVRGDRGGPRRPVLRGDLLGERRQPRPGGGDAGERSGDGGRAHGHEQAAHHVPHRSGVERGAARSRSPCRGANPIQSRRPSRSIRHTVAHLRSPFDTTTNNGIFRDAVNSVSIFGSGAADVIEGGINDDTLFGGGGDDRISGGPGNDTIDGGDGDDELSGGAGDDRISGGSGIDTAVFGGNIEEYEIVALDDGTFLIRDLGDADTLDRAHDGIDQIDGIERLMFANGIFELSADGSLVPFDEAANADNQQSRLLLIDGIDISRYLNNTVDSTDEAVHTDMVPGFYTLHEGALSRLENDPPPVGEWIAAGLAASAVAGVHMGSRDVVGGRPRTRG